jgi:two-component system sensor histidine kinase and response regulator WspE
MDDPNQQSSVQALFLNDLRADLSQITAIIDGKYGRAQWPKLLLLFEHISGCAKLANYPLIAQHASAVGSFLQHGLESDQTPYTSCVLVLKDGVRLLELILEEKGESVPWIHLAERWQASVPHFLQKPIAKSLSSDQPAVKPASIAAEGQELEVFLALFADELERQVTELNRALLKLEHDREDPQTLQILMSAAHSIKGAARAVDLAPLARLAHLMEERLVTAQHKQAVINETCFEILFEAVDFLGRLSVLPSNTIHAAVDSQKDTIEALCSALELCLSRPKALFPVQQAVQQTSPSVTSSEVVSNSSDKPFKASNVRNEARTQHYRRSLRINAETLNLLMGLAGEALVESRWLAPFAQALMKFKRDHSKLSQSVDQLRLGLQELKVTPKLEVYFDELMKGFHASQQDMNERLGDFEMFASRYSNIAERLYRAVIESRLRPFVDIIGPLPRMVRDLAKQLNKKVRLEIYGEKTVVDREILEKLEAPLVHLLRNAVDHGIEDPVGRLKLGKAEEGLIIVHAQHRAGMLAIDIIDDGHGIDLEDIKEIIINKQLVSRETADHLSSAELYDFMFLPGYSTATAVTEISGRGLGLVIVQGFVQEVGGRLRLESTLNKGLALHMLLPLTLSVMRALLVQVAGELYALPLAKIDRVLSIERTEVIHLEQHPYFQSGDENIGLISANEILDLPSSQPLGENLSVVVISDQMSRYALVVERFVGEKELVLHELDPLLGKVPNISAGAFAEDGTPILILDIEDLMRSIDMLLSGGRLHGFNQGTDREAVKMRQKRILIVDDSITVREVECRLLANQGYAVATAVNGVDGWNAVRTGQYDLVITDIDMPRMNGIEFVRTIRSDIRYRHLPVMIVSYKEREEDRIQGLDAGANYYLAKSSFHDEALVVAVRDLIGEPLTSSVSVEDKQ